MFFSFLAALAGLLLTGLQTLLIFFQGEGVCFNHGCRVVDSLTSVDPLIINGAGFVFFLFVTLGLFAARRGSDLWHRFVSLLLLAALAAEAVLLTFQILVSQAFCSYCLIILALIVAANLFMGPKQIFKGAVIFAAVLLASFSLDYRGAVRHVQTLEAGTMARVDPAGADHELFLFFSSNCEHCRTVLERLGASEGCRIRFNPVEPIESFSFPGALTADTFQPEANLQLLTQLGIDTVPALLSRDDGSLRLIVGDRAIMDFIDRTCGSPQPPQAVEMSSENMSTSFQLPLPIEEDGCTIAEDCDAQSSPAGIQ